MKTKAKRQLAWQRPVDPPIREDGRCVVCRRKRGPIAVRHLDPFDRTECARAWHDERRER